MPGEFSIERECRNCGKHFDVLYPDLWAYHRPGRNGEKMLMCSWKCIREWDEKHKKKEKKPIQTEEEAEKAAYRDRRGVIIKLLDAVEAGKDAYEHLKGEGYADPSDTMRRLRKQAEKNEPEVYERFKKLDLIDMRKGKGRRKGVKPVSVYKLTQEQKKKAVEIAIEGGDFKKYLKECGAKNPYASWDYIRMTLAKEDKEKYKELMAALASQQPEKKESKTGTSVTIPATRLVMDEKGIYVEKMPAVEPEKEFEYEVTAIKTEIGTFSITANKRQMIYKNDRNEDILMTVEEWKKMARTISGALKALGVKD